MARWNPRHNHKSHFLDGQVLHAGHADLHYLMQDWAGRPGHFGYAEFDQVLGPDGWCNKEGSDTTCPCILVRGGLGCADIERLASCQSVQGHLLGIARRAGEVSAAFEWLPGLVSQDGLGGKYCDRQLEHICVNQCGGAGSVRQRAGRDAALGK